MGMPQAPSFDQDGWRARTNVPDPSGINAAFDVGDASKDADWTQDTDILFRVRFVIKQTDATAASHSNIITQFILQYNNSTAGWNDVGAVGGGTEDVDFILADGFTDGDNTTQVIDSGTFRTGKGKETNTSTSVFFTEEALSETEIETSLVINASQVTDGDTIDLRFLYSNDDEDPPATVLEAYTAIPTITVNAIPVITDVDTDEEIDDKQTSVTITGVSFEAAQGTGKVEISDNETYGSGNVVGQTETSWGDTSIAITVVLGAMAPGNPRYVWVTNDDGQRNLVGFIVHVHRAQAFQMIASGNIAAGGEDTTAQLTAPTAGTFGGGRIQDDENAVDNIDLTDGQFREDEWCFEAIGTVVSTAEVYEFRVVLGGANGAAPETITVTPKMTIGTAGPSPGTFLRRYEHIPQPNPLLRM